MKLLREIAESIKQAHYNALVDGEYPFNVMAQAAIDTIFTDDFAIKCGFTWQIDGGLKSPKEQIMESWNETCR